MILLLEHISTFLSVLLPLNCSFTYLSHTAPYWCSSKMQVKIPFCSSEFSLFLFLYLRGKTVNLTYIVIGFIWGQEKNKMSRHHLGFIIKEFNRLRMFSPFWKLCPITCSPITHYSPIGLHRWQQGSNGSYENTEKVSILVQDTYAYTAKHGKRTKNKDRNTFLKNILCFRFLPLCQSRRHQMKLQNNALLSGL